MFGSWSNTVGRPSGSSRVTSSPVGLWYIRMRGRGSATRTLTSSPLMRTSSPGPTFWPTSAGSRLTVMRPARISSSIARREPNPHAASTLCRRCGSVKTSSVDRLCRGGGKLSAIACNARFGWFTGPVGGRCQDRARERELRFGGFGACIGHLQQVGSVELGQRRKLRQRAQAEIVEKGLGGRIKRRTARRLLVTDHFDPLAIRQRRDDAGGH